MELRGKWLYGLLRNTASDVCLDCGSSHSTIYTREEISTLPTPEVTVADTVGAGDAFSGALIISLLKGKSLSEAHHFAVKTAAFVCTKEGALACL